MLTLREGSALVKLARGSIQDYLENKETFLPKEKAFQAKRGVFVTLHEKGRLRGCIGIPYPRLPLGEAIAHAAKAAAFSDPRFHPLCKEELDKLEVEVSVLTEPREICIKNESDIKNIKPGRDGIIIYYGGCSGLLLPQVATEYHMNTKQFLEATCQKAGLARDAWKVKGCKILTFQAQIFSETKKGKIKQKLTCQK